MKDEELQQAIKQKQVEQPQARPLTEIEKNWIKEHYVKDKLTLEDLNRQLPGVDLNEVAAYVNTVYQPPKPGQPIQDRQSQPDEIHIFVVNPDKGTAPSGFVDAINGEVGYGVGATKVAAQIEIGTDKQRRMEDNPDCFCKLIVVQGTPVFYIKADLTNRLANPWDAVTSVSQETRFTKRTGRPAWKFMKVSQECFELYLKFLDTRNTNYYRNCERINRNG